MVEGGCFPKAPIVPDMLDLTESQMKHRVVNLGNLPDAGHQQWTIVD